MIRILLKKFTVLVLLVVISWSAHAITYPINIMLSGSQEVPPNSSPATGTLVGTYNDSTNLLKYTVTFSGLTANTTAAHFHGPAFPGFNAPVVFGAAGFPTGVTGGTYTDSLTLSAGQEDTLKRGLWYFNIHTSAFPGGEIRGQVFLQSTSFVVPNINCPSNIVVSADSAMCSASVTFAATDTVGNPASSINYRIGNTSITSPHVFPRGTTTVIATAVNAAGFDTCRFTVTVNDTQAPVITCPGDTTVPNDPGQCGAVVNFAARAIDNCGGVTITYSHAPGSLFPVGTTMVQAFAADSSGNRDTCSFNITVNDVEPPTIDSLSTSPRVLWPPNHKMRNVRVDYTATDNCPGPISCHITVTSNEPEDGPGGPHGPDWQIIDDHRIRLRAERSGAGAHRIYTVTVNCSDQYNNTSSADTVVLVPHDMSSALIRLIVGLGNGSPNGRLMMSEKIPERTSVVSIYPNPSNNYFNINIQAASSTERISIRLIDLAGRILETKQGITGSQTLAMGHQLKAGYYIVEVTQGNESKLIKVVKQ